MNYLHALPRPVKRAIHLAVDLFLIPFSLLVAFQLRLTALVPYNYLSSILDLSGILIVVGAPLSVYLRIPSIQLKAYEQSAVLRTCLWVVILMVISILASFVFAIPTPRTVPLIFGLSLFLMSVGTRILGAYVLSKVENFTQDSTPVAIYGAGAAGIQLISALRNSREVRCAVLVDDNPSLQGVIIAGLRVEPPENLKKHVASGRIERVLLAIPSLPDPKKREIILRLSDLNCEVQSLPSYVEIIKSDSLSSSLKDITPDDLLGRERVQLDVAGTSSAYHGKRVLITGAGGSIGSELCRQVLAFGVKSLVLFDQSEFALYSIEQELQPQARAFDVQLTAYLGSVADYLRMRQIIEREQIETVLHAAAYKHVPLVESNEVEGLRNNVLGTYFAAKASVEFGVERFILISTDKAVRPTSFMGATKRMAELTIQDMDSHAEKTVFTMVRFGNVLGSSGSVVPLFKSQIGNGGPVTVTHPDITRYFMTIPEASRLVLLAGSFAEGGEVFVLDMGEPVKIYDLACRMISLSGRTLKSKDNQSGDIEIHFTGLRPGEKLYEELLIDAASLPTMHPKIMRASEGKLSSAEMAHILEDVQSAVETLDSRAAREIISRWVCPVSETVTQD